MKPSNCLVNARVFVKTQEFLVTISRKVSIHNNLQNYTLEKIYVKISKDT